MDNTSVYINRFEVLLFSHKDLVLSASIRRYFTSFPINFDKPQSSYFLFYSCSCEGPFSVCVCVCVCVCSFTNHIVWALEKGDVIQGTFELNICLFSKGFCLRSGEMGYGVVRKQDVTR